MLVLNRAVGEEIYIDGGNARVVLDEIYGKWACFAVHVDGKTNRYSLATNATVNIHRGGRLLAVMMVCKVEPTRVSFGFEADPAIIIDREEIHHVRHQTRWGLNELESQRESRRARAVGENPRDVRGCGSPRAAI